MIVVIKVHKTFMFFRISIILEYPNKFPIPHKKHKYIYFL